MKLDDYVIHYNDKIEELACIFNISADYLKQELLDCWDKTAEEESIWAKWSIRISDKEGRQYAEETETDEQICGIGFMIEKDAEDEGSVFSLVVYNGIGDPEDDLFIASSPYYLKHKNIEEVSILDFLIENIKEYMEYEKYNDIYDLDRQPGRPFRLEFMLDSEDEKE